jgi:hypothetical protein
LVVAELAEETEVQLLDLGLRAEADLVFGRIVASENSRGTE